MTHYIRPRSSIAPIVGKREQERLDLRDERRAQHFLDAVFALLVLVVLFIVVCLPPPGAPR